MGYLKADVHTHSADDPRDALDFSTEMLIDAASQLNFGVLAVTCHEAWRYSPRLAEYARRRGIVLAPGLEQLVEGKHVLLLNPDAEQAAARTFAELRALGKRDAAIIAPHPFYPSRTSLRRALLDNIDLFDAIEYCTLYFPWLNFNRRAVRVAREYGLPLVGTSDTHALPLCDSTYTWIDGEPSVFGVIEAIRAGRVRLETRPRPLGKGLRMIWYALRSGMSHIAGSSDQGG